MDKKQLEQAHALRRQGQSFRQIARAMGVAPATVGRALAYGVDSSSTIERIREERLKKLRHQNDKLHLELQRLKASVVNVEEIKQSVIKANTVVKTQFLALGPRLATALASISDAREISRLLTQEITAVLNELAYESEE